MKKLELNDWITSSGKYPERAKSYELTANVIKNAKILLDKVNLLLEKLDVKEDIKISSGFRPSYINKLVPNSAKKSAHMTGEALDLALMSDKIKTIPLELLKECDLYLEHPDFTKTWRHLQTRRTASGNRVFKP